MDKTVFCWTINTETLVYSQPFGPKKEFMLKHEGHTCYLEMRTANKRSVEVDVMCSQKIAPNVWSLLMSSTLTFTENQFSIGLIDHLLGNTLIVMIKEVTPKPEPSTRDQHDTNIIEDLRKLFGKEDTKDVVFNIGSQTIKAHKLILQLRSPVFERMFNVEMNERLSHEVTIDDVSFNGFSAFLEFVYTGNCTDFDPVEELLYLGDKYEVNELKSKAANLLFDAIDAENALHILVLFDRFRLRQLKHEAIKYIISNEDEVYDSDKKAEFERRNPHLADLIEVGFEVAASRK